MKMAKESRRFGILRLHFGLEWNRCWLAKPKVTTANPKGAGRWPAFPFALDATGRLVVGESRRNKSAVIGNVGERSLDRTGPAVLVVQPDRSLGVEEVVSPPEIERRDPEP